MSGEGVVVSRSGGAPRDRPAPFAGSRRAAALFRGPREARSRLHPEPKLAVYTGSGSSDDAANFVCRDEQRRKHLHDYATVPR